MNVDWSAILGVEFPQCAMCAQCCNFASPSSSIDVLREKALQNDEFAQDFISIFEPYSSLEEVKKLNPKIVESAIEIISKGENKITLETLQFYKCKFISESNKCLVHEDRPQLCRNYPDTPYLLFAPDCAYENWSKECKKKYEKLKNELENFKKLQIELGNKKLQNRFIANYQLLMRLPQKYHFIINFKNPQWL